MASVAGAPVSFGVYGPADAGPWADPDSVLAVLRDAGYDGVDLGPVGWLGRGQQLRRRLRHHCLTLAGGWVELPLSADRAFAAARVMLDDALAAFTAAAALDPDLPPLPTLADSGSPVRRAHPGGASGIGLDRAGWERLAANVRVAADQVRRAGLQPTFHHHVGTHVETPDEIDEFLAVTEVGLTLDTGHLLLGGGDPVAALARWSGRINHVHLKDARREVLEQAVAEGAGMAEVWRRGVFVPLGTGDLDLAAFMDALVEDGFDGWVVVEQDVVMGDGEPLDRPAADQRANREVLRRWLP